MAALQGAAAAILDDRGAVLLIRENYGRHRYGFPGGEVEDGETPELAVVREVLEETCAAVVIDHAVGVYRLVDRFTCTLFRCTIVAGSPTLPSTGEIAEVAWFAANSIPEPRTNVLHHALADVLAGARDVFRDDLPRIS